MLLVLVPVTAALVTVMLILSGIPVHAYGVAIGVAGGVTFGMVGRVESGVAFVVAFVVAFIMAFMVTISLGISIEDNVAYIVALVIAFIAAFFVAGQVSAGVAGGIGGVAGGVGGVVGGMRVVLGGEMDDERSVVAIVAGIGVVVGAVVGIVGFVEAGVTAVAVAGVVGLGVAVGVVVVRLPLWLAEAVLTQLLAWWMQRRPDTATRLAFWLPLLYHELIYVPLPGLRGCLIHIAEVDPVLGKEFINVAAASVGQRRLARLAVIELQARELESAARGRIFARAASCDFPFLPKETDLALEPVNAPFLAFQTAARDLIAGSTSQRQRHLALERARNSLESFRVATAGASRPTPQARRLLPTAALWLQVVYDEADKLIREVAARPEVPVAFIAGPPLTPDHAEDRSLFKGRGDIIKLIEHDLAPERRGVLMVIGQRRMGKTSLCNWLPPYLGTGTTVVVSNFQALSGDAHRETPHRRVLGDIAARFTGTPGLPESDRWGEALHWLEDLDRTCADRKILVVIDEVERVEDGIRDGWCSSDFLDFLRSAGDSLRHIRFLLLTAYPLHRLGPHWTDRLVSATSRTISYLDEADAWELLTHPIPEFPDIYPEGGIELILAQTGRHPYLLQKAGDDLCRLLNSRGGLRRATLDELTEVFDGMVRDIQVFDEIWHSRTEGERMTLRRLAQSDEPGDLDPSAIQLAREDYLVRRGDQVTIAVPLFREWIRMNVM